MNESVIFWIILAILLGVIESATFALVSIWAAISAIVCAILSSIGLSDKIVALIFLIITAVLLIFTRPFVKKYLNKNIVATNADRIINKEALVVKKITKDLPGQVKVNGQVWTAYSEDGSEIPEGFRVRIISIEGVKAIVVKI